METLRIGMISFAHIGHATSYARCLKQIPGVELVAVADDDEVRGREQAANFGTEFYTDYHDLLARGDIAAVVVCSENARHREMVVAAAQAGKHVLCEKPLATTREDGLAMVVACREARVKLQIAFPMRFSPPAVALRDAVRAGAVGTPLMVQATNPGRMPPGWFSDPALAGGGAVMDHTVHVADMLRWIFEREITSVYAEIDTRIHPGLPTDDVGLLLLGLDGGISASLDASWARAKTWPIWGGVTMDVIGDKGVVSLNAFNQNVQLFDDRAGTYSLVPFAASGDPPLVQGFIDAIRNDTDPPVTGEDGLRALEVTLCAYESARRHEPVACPDCLLR
ncbi:MAG: Gfo/Idh/MocA family oxidoreductase [Chloroflexia bacterium]